MSLTILNILIKFCIRCNIDKLSPKELPNATFFDQVNAESKNKNKNKKKSKKKSENMEIAIGLQKYGIFW